VSSAELYWSSRRRIANILDSEPIDELGKAALTRKIKVWK